MLVVSLGAALVELSWAALAMVVIHRCFHDSGPLFSVLLVLASPPSLLRSWGPFRSSRFRLLLGVFCVRIRPVRVFSSFFIVCVFPFRSCMGRRCRAPSRFRSVLCFLRSLSVNLFVGIWVCRARYCPSWLLFSPPLGCFLLTFLLGGIMAFAVVLFL